MTLAFSTGRATADDLFLDFLLDQIIDAAYSQRGFRALMKNRSLAGRPTDTLQFPRWPALTAAAVAENADIVSTAINTTSVQITVGEVGIAITLSDALQEDDIVAGTSEYAAQCGKALADKQDADGTALLGGHSTSVGLTGVGAVDLTEANFLLLINALEMLDAPMPYVSVFNPFNVNQLRTDIVANGGNVYSTSRESRFGARMGYFQFDLFNVPIASTTNVVLETDNYQGGMFSLGQAHAYVSKREARAEPDRDASFRLSEVVLTSRYGVGEIVDLYGVTFFGDDA